MTAVTVPEAWEAYGRAMVFRRRWPTASKAYLAIAVACGLAAFGLTRGYALRLRALHADVGPAVAVVVASVDIPRGGTLQASQVRTEQIPKRYVPPGALRSTSAAAGRVSLTDIAVGEVVTGTRLAPAGSGPVAALVPPGLRAYPIAADVPPGSLRPGDSVDVLAAFGGQQAHAETVASGLRVLRVIPTAPSSSLTPGGPGAEPNILLIVSPDDAERLSYASAFAHLSVAIEPPPDTST